MKGIFLTQEGQVNLEDLVSAIDDDAEYAIVRCRDVESVRFVSVERVGLFKALWRLLFG